MEISICPCPLHTTLLFAPMSYIMRFNKQHEASDSHWNLMREGNEISILVKMQTIWKMSNKLRYVNDITIIPQGHSENLDNTDCKQIQPTCCLRDRYICSKSIYYLCIHNCICFKWSRKLADQNCTCNSSLTPTLN